MSLRYASITSLGLRLVSQAAASVLSSLIVFWYVVAAPMTYLASGIAWYVGCMIFHRGMEKNAAAHSTPSPGQNHGPGMCAGRFGAARAEPSELGCASVCCSSG
jgi:hypothetical protein